MVADGRTAFHHSAVERQVDCRAGSRVGQAGSACHHAQGVGERTGAIGAEGRGEVGGEALGGVRRQVRFIDGQDWFRAGGADAWAVILEHQVLADVEGGLGAVAIPVGFGRGQGHQVVGGQGLRVIGVVGVGVHDGAKLVEGDLAVAGDADGEHQVVADGRTAFHYGAIERQVDCRAGGRVGQAGSACHHAKGVGERTGTIGAEGRGEVGGEALGGVRRQVRFIDGQDWFRAGGADARAVILEHQVLADVEGSLGAVAVLVGLGRGQGHQVVGGQGLRVIGVVGVGMHDGAKLVEGNGTVAGDADGEHQKVGGGRAAFHHGAIERQVDRLAGGRVGQAGGTRHHAQGVGERTGAIGAEGRGEVGGEALRGVGRQDCFIDSQDRFRTRGADTGPIVFEAHLGADFGGCGRNLAQHETADIEVGMFIAFGVDGGPILDEYAVVILCGGVLDLLAGFDAGEGGDAGSKADDDARVIHRPV